MGSLDGLGGHLYYAPGRVYGIAFRIQRRLHVVGLCQRGLFWRFGANVFSPIGGYWESIFGVRTGWKQIETIATIGMRNEIIPVSFRPRGVSGSIHFSRTGLISCVFVSLDNKRFIDTGEQARKSLALAKDEAHGVYDSIKEWY